MKSIMNYIGNKYRLLPQLLELFPEDCDNFLDLFVGGSDVSINYNAGNKSANDINKYVIGIYKAFQEQSYEEIYSYLWGRQQEFNLSKSNKEGYLRYRDFYNQGDRNPLDLYLLMNYSFNYQIRFNNNHEYNNPFGANRSSWNESLQSRLEEFISLIKDIQFTSLDFREVDYSSFDFCYADPPYSLSVGSYNDGKRGFNGWSLQDDIDLMIILDSLNDRGSKFALSNVLEHKGEEHKELIQWSKKYNVHELSCSYANSNYQAKASRTREVLITNY